MLKENALLIKIVAEYQNKGKVFECMKYHDILTRNLLYLSGISDFQADEEFSISSAEAKQHQAGPSGDRVKKIKLEFDKT